MPSADKIINKFNDATYELVQLQGAVLQNDPIAIKRHKDNAGRALYENFEVSIKHQIENNPYISTTIKRSVKNSNIEQLYDKFDESFRLEEDDDVEIDLAYLKTARSKINSEKHEGADIVSQEELLKFHRELRRFIKSYIINSSKLKSISDYEQIQNERWDNFYAATGYLEGEETNLIAIVGRLEDNEQEYYKSLAIPEWSLVIDLDHNSRTNGFYHKGFSVRTPSPTVINGNDNTSIDTFSVYAKQHYHVFFNGFPGSGMIPPKDYNEWERKYETLFERLVQNFSEKYSRPTKVIILAEHVIDDYIVRIGQIFRKHLGDRVEFIFAVPDVSEYEYAVRKLGAKVTSVSISEISDGILNFCTVKSSEDIFDGQVQIPFNEDSISADVSGFLSADIVDSIETQFHLLHKGLDTKVFANEEIRDFLSGLMPISWYGLRNDWDKKHRSLRGSRGYIEVLRNALKNGKGKIELIHEAGYGGTTIARRIAWETHNDYPTLILKEFRGQTTVSELIRLYDRTKRTIFVIIEVPQVMNLDDVENFYRAVIGRTRPVVFLIVRRGSVIDIAKFDNHLFLPDWGLNTSDLVSSYIPYLAEYNNSAIEQSKTVELEGIVSTSEKSKKTPFYVGLITFEENFHGIRDYISKFVDELYTKQEQKKTMVYLALTHSYLGNALPAQFFSKLFETDPKEIVKLEEFLPRNVTTQGLIVPTMRGKTKLWSPRHYLFSRELKMQLLNPRDNPGGDNWKDNLADYCISFIEDSNTDVHISEYVSEIMQDLFIGTRKDRAGNAFTQIVNDIKGDEDKERVFLTLAECYPDNPHFCSHLARYYAYYQRNNERAFHFADKAISLAEAIGRPEPLLYHIKGMCVREAAFDQMKQLENQVRKNDVLDSTKLNLILGDLIPQAEAEFSMSRKLSKELGKSDEHGFIAHIQLLIRAIDFGSIIRKQSKSLLLSGNNPPYTDWLDKAETLLEEVKRASPEASGSAKIQETNNNLNLLIEEFDIVLQNLNTQLEKGNNPTKVRRQIVRTLFKKNQYFTQRNQHVLERIIKLMEDNIESEPAIEANFFLWFKAARHSNISIENALSKLTRWKINSDAIDALYYLYILKVFRAIEKYSTDAVQAEKYIKECKRVASKGPNFTTCFEWYGKGDGLHRLINRAAVTSENKVELLEYVEGYFRDYNHDGSGTIVVEDKLEVFCNPSQGKLTLSDKNKRVKFFLGFSYDGLIADSSSIIVLEDD